MVDLASERLATFGTRATVALSNGGPPVAEATASYDRFVSNFVLDLLSEHDIRGVIAEAHRILVPNGLLGLCSLTAGFNAPTRFVAGILSSVHRLRPQLIGGCRALELQDFLPPSQWQVRHVVRVAPLCVPLQAVVAQRV
jgi:hypothetical protein